MLYAIADTHLSFGVSNKDMCIFKGWTNHSERLRENWNRVVGEDDTVVIAGDISWGSTLTQALPDFEFIDKQLDGSKIILKGNHDYWWNTTAKTQQFFCENNINSIQILHNNAYKIKDIAICGTRGWLEDVHIMQREAGRLEVSIKSGLEMGGEPIVFLHYPPIYAYEENEYVLEVLRKYAIKRVYFGHIHSSGLPQAFMGERYGIQFDMITADYLKFMPKKIL